MSSLYTIDNEIQNLLMSYIDESTGEIQESALSDLEFLQENRKEKLQNIILFFKNTENEEVIIDRELARLKSLKTRSQKKQEFLKKILQESMRKSGENKLEYATCSASIRKNPPSVIIEGSGDLSEFTKKEIILKVDKVAIKKAIQSGREIEGVRLVQNESLIIN